MNFDDLKGKTIDDALLATIRASFDEVSSKLEAARDESIKGRKKLKADFEATQGHVSSLLEKLGVETVEEALALPDQRGAAETAKQYEARMKRLERDLAAVSAARDDAVKRHRNAALQAAITEAVSKHPFIEPDLVKEYIAARAVWEEEELRYKADDGKLTSISDGVAGFAKARPTLIKAQGAGGAGARPPAAGGDGGVQAMPRAQYETLPPAQQLELARKGVTLT